MAFFHKSGLPNISIMTFIYIEKKGLVGKLYKHFINKALYCHSLKYIFVLSTNEISKYETIFPQIKGKIIFHKMGISNETVFPAKKGNYYLSAGRSNRDYDFLLKCFEENRLPLIILSDTFKPKDLPSNIKIIDNCFGTDFEKMVSECFCFLISLKDVPVSSGQLATLTALKYHKPVIACKNPGINDYISNDVNGFLINKDYSELMNCINKLQDNNVYSRLTTNKQVYTDFTLGQNIGDNLMDQN
jgi:glycosyltransferase involved in cell wall biosynthesis